MKVSVIKILIGTYEEEMIEVKKTAFIEYNFIKVKVEYGEEIISRKDTANEILVEKNYLINEYKHIEFNYFKDDIYYKEIYDNGESVYFEEKKIGRNLIINDYTEVYTVYYDDCILSSFTDINDVFLFIKNVFQLDYEPYEIYSYPTINNETEYIIVRNEKIHAKYNDLTFALTYSKILSEVGLEAKITRVMKHHLYLPFFNEIKNINVEKLPNTPY